MDNLQNHRRMVVRDVEWSSLFGLLHGVLEEQESLYISGHTMEC